MKKKIIKRIIIITVVINVIIFLVIAGKITIEKSKEEIAKRFPSFSQPALFDGSTKSACTDGEDYHAQIVYARAKDTTSRYQDLSPKLRSWFRSADGIVNEEAKKFKMSANLKVLCENGEISVIEAVLPNTDVYYASAPQETRKALIKDLGLSGYNKENTKYIVWYDGKASGCGGNACISQQSIKGPDDQLSEDNIYNVGPDYAILYKVDDATIQQLLGTSYDMVAPILMLHEYAHTLGAVQPSAPHATKKETSAQKHCIDSPTIGQGGTDIMCKSDAQGEVFGNECPGMFPFRFDCNNDDYFNPKPDPGSYLATHWNLGSPLNRFIKFGQ
ncbi:hypothetical protein HY407_02435 [Candidatus Gottesmanbacteria bacterium]|nr:hypothetical protein [Candidatus Gottesmanbacteria bacterium]